MTKYIELNEKDLIELLIKHFGGKCSVEIDVGIDHFDRSGESYPSFRCAIIKVIDYKIEHKPGEAIDEAEKAGLF